ncbi:hypothetical protein Sjap_022498 [Stephania japonica]|uniref:Uncharacterized protein n=1 Tax=Stephania japonica TaxID=461633 RepID=A0AAP0EPI1_9MAGN
MISNFKSQISTKSIPFASQFCPSLPLKFLDPDKIVATRLFIDSQISTQSRSRS